MSNVFYTFPLQCHFFLLHKMFSKNSLDVQPLMKLVRLLPWYAKQEPYYYTVESF